MFKLSAEDIQRAHSPEDIGIYWRVCGDCRERFRSAARLEVDYGTSKALRDVSLMVPLCFGVLLLLELVVPSLILVIDALILFTGIGHLFRELSGRYVFTHNLAWCMKNRSVMIGVSLTFATLLRIIIR